MYANENRVVQLAGKVFAVSMKNVIAITFVPFLLFLDIATGESYFTQTLVGIKGQFNFTLPYIGWHANWDKAFLLGVGMSMMTSGLQIAMWNLLKSNVKLGKNFKPIHWAALGAGIVALIFDVMSDLGGATMWVTGATDGRLWPASANIGQGFVILLLVALGVANDAILVAFFGIDKPIMADSKLQRIPRPAHRRRQPRPIGPDPDPKQNKQTEGSKVNT